MILRKVALGAAVIGTSAALMACGGDDGKVGRPATTVADDGVMDAVVSFYPLQYVVQRIGGDAVRVSNLTPAGAEPHDVELSPADVKRISEADLVVFLSGFQPGVDDAVNAEALAQSLDVAASAQLGLSDGQTTDPHFWLDPLKLSNVAGVVAAQMIIVETDRGDQARIEQFRANLLALQNDLDDLDAEYRAALASCRSKDLVTSHAAFGYLAAAYGFTQRGITGLSPEAEPNAGALGELTRFVRDAGVTTIYSEVLVDPAVARTVADETGASVALLDPLEGLAEGGSGDYLSIMRANLATLVAGQGCS